MIDTVALKNRILNLAIEGKLSEQLESDGNAESIANEIDKQHKERAEKGKEKYTKIRTLDNAIVPFDIPKTWRWFYISDMSIFQEGPGILAKDFRKEGIPLIRIAGMNADILSLAGCNYLDPQMVEEKWKHFKLDIGDIVISTSASLDRICEVTDETAGAIPYTGQIRFKMLGNIKKEYFKLFIKSSFYMQQINAQKQGGFISHYGPTHLKKMIIPVPPIEEQKRIVERVNAVLELVEIIDLNQKKYSSDLEILKSKIIDAGIQGKLTEQLPEDGTADELLKQIVDCQNNMIKAGKIKKPKDIKNIDIEDIPFEIPNTWKWEKWGNIINVVSARRVHQSDWRKEGIPFYRAREIAKLAVDGSVENDLFISQELYDEFSIDRVPQPGDLMVSAVGTLGKSYVVKDGDLFYYKDASVLCFENYGGMNPYYLRYVMQSSLMKNQIESNSGGTTVDTLTMVRMVQYILPIPPLNEQDRIVNKINEILEIL